MSTKPSAQRPHRCALGALVLLVALATTAGCASSAGTSSEHTARTSTPPPGPSSTHASTEPMTSLPTPGAAGIAVSGPVPARVISSEGPTTDGVFAAHSVAALLHGMQRAGHGFLSCAPAQCWQGRQLPAHSIGVAFQANPLGCEQVDSITVSSPRPGSIRLAVQAHPVCTRGGGAAAKGMAILIAIPLSALPRDGTLTAQVDIAMRPGDEFKALGSASTSL